MLIIAPPASAAATYTFFVSGTSVGVTSPGVSKDYALNLTNLNSSASISFNLSIVASPLGWTTQLSQSSLTVGPSTTRQVTLTVQPPLSALADSVGQYVNVTATPDDNTTSQTVSTTTRVTESFGVTVTIIPQAGTSGDPGVNITWLAYVKNTGNSVQSYTVNINNTSYTTTNLTTNLITVLPGDTRVILVTINFSATAGVGTLYSRMTATSNANSSSVDSKEFSATVNAKRSVGLSGLTSDDLHAYSESESSVGLTNIIIENRGNVADSYRLQGTANASRHGDWVSFEFTALSLSPFSQRYLNVTVAVPAGIAVGDHTVEIRIISDNSTSVIAFLNLTITVTNKHDLSLVYENLAGKQSGEPGTTVAFPIVVSNPGAFTQIVNMDYAGPNSTWVAISTTIFSLTAGSSLTVYYNFSIPGTQSPGSFGFQVLGSIDFNTPPRNRSLNISLEVKQVYDVITSVAVGAGSGLPGATVVYTMNVRNNGTGADNFTVTATNATQAGLLTLSSTTLSLPLGGQTNVTITIVIRTSPAPPTDVYYYGITVRSSGNVSKSAGVNLALTVNQTFGLSATVSPAYQIATPGNVTVYNISVQNNGNGADTVTLQRAGNNQTWVAFPTGTGTIASGARMNFTIEVTPPSYSDPGDTVLTALVVSGGNGNVTTSPTFTISLTVHYEFQLHADSPNVAAHRNITYQVPMTLRNAGNREDTYSIEVFSADVTWATLPFATITLQPNEDNQFTVRVQTPLNPANGGHLFSFTVTSLTNVSWTTMANFTVTVNDIFKPEVSLANDFIFGQPFTTAVFQYLVLNNGSITDTYTFTATATFPNATQVFTRNYTLVPGQAAGGNFAVSLLYPFSGTYPVVFTFQSVGNLSFADHAYANVTLEVLRFVDLSAATDIATGGPNDVVNFTLTVRNFGNITDTYNLSYTAPGPGWSLTFSNDSVTLAPNASINVTAWLQAPVSLAAGTYTTTLGATSLAAGISVRDLLNVRFVVTYLALLSSAAADPSLLPGATATLSALLVNSGSANDQFTITAAGQAAGWTVVQPPTVSLLSLESVTISLDVTVPASQHDGLRNLTLEVRSARTGALRQVFFNVTVLKVYGYDLLEPAGPISSTPGLPVNFTLTVTNTGNTNESYSFLAVPSTVKFTPANLTIDAPASANVTITFTPLSTAPAGTQPIVLTVFGSGGKTRTVYLNATVRQVYNLAAHGLPSDTFTATGAPGLQVQLSFNMTNLGNGPDTLIWSLSGPAASWAQTPSGAQLLPAGGGALVFVNLDIPSNLLVATAGPRAISVLVQSQVGGAGVAAWVNGSVIVSEVPSLTLSLDPDFPVISNDTSIDRADTTPKEYTLYLANTGNRNETVTLSRTTPNGWSILLLVGSSTATPITLAPGAKATATLRLTGFPASATQETVRVSARVPDGRSGQQEVSVVFHFLEPNLVVDASSVHASATSAKVGDTVSITFTVRNTGSGTAAGVSAGLVVDGTDHLPLETLPSILPGQTQDVTLSWTATSGQGGKTHTLVVETSTGLSLDAGSVSVAPSNEGLIAKVLTDHDLWLMMGIAAVAGLALGLTARGGKRRKGPSPAPRGGPGGPSGTDDALAGLAALEAEGQGPSMGPAAGPPSSPGAVEHKIVCPNCGTEQWIRGAEGECKTCGVIIEVAEEEAPGASEGA